jgi:hypothetical protein
MKQRRDVLLRLIWLVALVAWLVPLRAERVRPEDAKRAAKTVLNALGGRCNSVSELTDISEEAGYQNLYVFNGQEGYVVLAADNRISPVLCFSPNGNLNAEQFAMLGVWLDRYEEQVDYVIEHRLPNNENNTRLWNNLIEGSIGEMMIDRGASAQLSTNWGQGNPYNIQCPYDYGQEKYCYTGSVATAMAQIMKYWEHPKQGNGHRTNGANYGQYGDLYADFGATTYDWDLMNWSNNPTFEEKQAVAQLMLHCGIAVSMVYDYEKETSTYQGSYIGNPGAPSDAFCDRIQDAFKNYFFYKCPYFVERSDVGNEEWVSLLHEALEADPPRPVLYTAKNNNGIFHAFVCDGIADFFGVQLFHCVWGMDGMSSNFCYLNELAPGFYPSYDSEELAFFGIEPDRATITTKQMYIDGEIESSAFEYPKGNTITLTAPEEAVYQHNGVSIRCTFERWTKDVVGGIQTVSYEPTVDIKVEGDEVYCAQYSLRTHHINVDCVPEEGGVVSGGGTYGYGTHVILTAVPNLGYVFRGWYEGDIHVGINPDYEMYVGYDRNLTAHFEAANFTVNVAGAPFFSGTVSGGGTYPAQTQVTVTASPTSNHYFRAWIENGEVVSTQQNYTFTLSSNRNLTAIFGATTPPIAAGSVITNPDGSMGVVFYTNPTGTGGTMVALDDASDGCAWGNEEDIYVMNNYTDSHFQYALNDMNGYANTEAIRNQQGTGTGYAADVVDFANGWYLPSANQLRKLYGALPLIENAIESQGGALMTENSYWSSTEYSKSNAWNPMFAMGHTSKTSNCRVRAVRDFSFDGNFIISVESSIGSLGIAAGGGVYADGAQVTVVATTQPSSGYVFNCWKENGIEVSKSQIYNFTAHSNRHLVATFTKGAAIGNVITNSDGSKGVVFYADPTGTRGTMVALEDASDGCIWGGETDIYEMKNYTDSYGQYAINDRNGYANTEAIRNRQGTGTGNAADVVDFEHGWYLPSANQLRKLYAALPFIETVIQAEGGSVMTEDSYWSSTEYSNTNAWNPMFAMGHTGKTSNCRVRAVRDFSLDGNFVVIARPNNVNLGSVTGLGVYEPGAEVTLTASPSDGYVFSNWTENGVEVSSDATYTFSAYSFRNLMANFVKENSMGTVVTNADGSKGVVFYTDPTGLTGWMVALEDDSEGCPWGDNQNVLALEDQNPSSVQNMLDDLNGYHNTQVLRGWFMDNPDYAASKVDFANGWYLPSAGQLRKLYAALPFIETAILKEGGTTLSDGGYWSSSECSDGNAWSPAFAFGTTTKTSNLRVRAIHNVYREAVTGDFVFIGANNSSWSDVSNWINNNGMPPGPNDDVIISANCVMNMNATVKSVTIQPRSELTVTANHCLNVIESINNSASSRIILEDNAQLINPSDDVYVSVQKTIQGYGDNPNSSWYTISTPIKDGTGAGVLATDCYDLYQYFEQFHYWLNHKEDGNDFTRLNCGFGYLYASQESRTISFNGTVRASNSEFYKSITNSPNSAPINGFNLIGNPFTNNINISSLSMNGAAFTTYYKVKNGSTLLVYTDADQEPIRPAEGFFVYGDAGYVCYNTPSKGEQDNSYVRLVLNQGEEMLDRTYLRMNEGEALNKAYVDRHPSLLYFNCQGQNFAVASQQARAYNLCFEAVVEGTFTIECSLLNAECQYLHLVDRITGADIDLLITPTYSFEASTADVQNRFVLVLAEGAQPENYQVARNRNLLPLLPTHTESTNQPAYYEEAYTTQTSILSSGWTWWAPQVHVSVSEIQSALGNNVLQIRSENGTATGNVTPGQMLRIQTNAPCTLSLTGMRFTAASITVNPGPNWFGYIGVEAPISQALNGFPPSVDDKIISQDGGFAVYNGTEWEGTLTTLEPGKGYVYVSTAAWSKTIVFE